ncbi:protein of unknown function [Paraburkholderia kururiensis]
MAFASTLVTAKERWRGVAQKKRHIGSYPMCLFCVCV